MIKTLEKGEKFLRYLFVVSVIFWISVISFLKLTEVKSSYIFVESEKESTLITRIGDVCDDRNKLTTNDFYIDTKGTCEGARVDRVASK